MSWGTNALFAAGGAAAAFAIVKMTSRVPEGAIEISGLGDLHRPWNPLHAPNTGPHRPPRRRSRRGGGMLVHHYKWRRVSDAHVRQMEGSLGNLVSIPKSVVPKRAPIWVLAKSGCGYFRGGSTNRFYHVCQGAHNAAIMVLFDGDYHPTYSGGAMKAMSGGNRGFGSLPVMDVTAFGGSTTF